MANELPTHPRLDDDDEERATGRQAGDDGDESQQPLLGAEGDASAKQPEERALGWNVVTGTALLAQAGIWILGATVWAAIFSMKLMLFSVHPLLNSAALLFAVQAILVVQPTHTARQKRAGALAHATLNLLGFLAFAGALIAIEINKGDHARFTSVHGVLGLITYIVVLLQTAVGFTMYFVPDLYGSVDKAKGVWKYHRMSGYLLVTLSLATVLAATQTTFNVQTIGIELWVMVVCTILILAGIFPRIKPSKFGLKK